jgi:hypothetical protein
MLTLIIINKIKTLLEYRKKGFMAKMSRVNLIEVKISIHNISMYVINTFMFL